MRDTSYYVATRDEAPKDRVVGLTPDNVYVVGRATDTAATLRSRYELTAVYTWNPTAGSWVSADQLGGTKPRDLALDALNLKKLAAAREGINEKGKK